MKSLTNLSEMERLRERLKFCGRTEANAKVSKSSDCSESMENSTALKFPTWRAADWIKFVATAPTPIFPETCKALQCSTPAILSRITVRGTETSSLEKPVED